MGRKVIALGREIGGAEAVQPGLIGVSEGETEDQRGRLVTRWLELTRIVLPGMAGSHRWPIRYDHCFMRVLLDNALGGVWHRSVARPAIRHATDAQIEAAIALGERVVQAPEMLRELNERSLAWRRADRV